MDLLNTENSFREMQSVLNRSDQSATQLVRAFRSKDAPPIDSVHTWTFWAINFQRPFIVTGTVNTLLETGDINLVQNDSLRSAIIRYKDSIDQHIRYMVDNADWGIEHLAELGQRLDIGEPYLSGMPLKNATRWPGLIRFFPFRRHLGEPPCRWM